MWELRTNDPSDQRPFGPTTWPPFWKSWFLAIFSCFGPILAKQEFYWETEIVPFDPLQAHNLLQNKHFKIKKQQQQKETKSKGQFWAFIKKVVTKIG